jgi:5,10-methylenetetrahydromethanopterin reductase
MLGWFEWQLRRTGSACQRLAIEAVLEDGVDRAVGPGADPQPAPAGRLEPFGAVLAGRVGRSLAEFAVVHVVTLGLGPDDEVGARWMQSWFAPGQPFLAYPSTSNHRWLREAGLEAKGDLASIPEQRAWQIADAFRLFGSPERCAEPLLRARDEAGIEDVFLVPCARPCGRLPHAGTRAAGL